MIFGMLAVNKVPGSVSFSAGSRHHSFDASQIDTSHSVTQFSFIDEESFNLEQRTAERKVRSVFFLVLSLSLVPFSLSLSLSLSPSLSFSLPLSPSLSLSGCSH